MKNKLNITGNLEKLLSSRTEESLRRTRNRMYLSIKIYEAMKEKNWNQKQFSNIMGKSEPEISDWLSGERNFTVDLLSDIEGVLGIRLLDTSIMKYENIPTTNEHKSSSYKEIFKNKTNVFYGKNNIIPYKLISC